MMRALLRILALAGTCVATMPWPAGEAMAAEPVPAGKEGLAQTELKRLEGRWTRLDGGYVIEVRGVREDGFAAAADRLKGIYFQAVQKQTFEVEFARAR
jgi:hypothetical protein